MISCRRIGLFLGIAFLGVFLLWPLSQLAGLSAAIWPVGLGRYYIYVVQLTVFQAVLSSICAAILGLPGALLFAEGGMAWRQFLAFLSVIPFSFPPLVLALGLLGVWGRQGWVSGLMEYFTDSWSGIYGWSGVLLGHALLNFPIFVRLVGQALLERDTTDEKVALSLGVGRALCLRHIVWPKLRASFWSAFGLVFFLCAGSFVLVLLLGGGPRFTTIEVAIYQALKYEANFELARWFGLLQLIAVGIGAALWTRTVHPPARLQRGAEGFTLMRSRRAWGGAYAVFLILFWGLPLCLLVVRGLKEVLGLVWLLPLLRSLVLAFGVGLIATVVALGLARGVQNLPRSARALIVFIATLPLGISSVLLLLGWRLAFPDWLRSDAAQWWGVVIVQSLLAVPLALRPMLRSVERLESTWDRVAQSLGARAWQRWLWVEWPALRPSVFLAFLFSAGLSLGEAAAVLLFPSESTQNLTYAIYQSMARYRFDEAYADALVLLMLSSALAWGLVRYERSRARC